MKKLLLTLIFLLTSIGLSYGQSSDVNVTADVQPVITVTNQQDLNFGTIVEGNTKTILPTDGDAGEVSIDGGEGSTVIITFTLPSELSQNSNTIPISFSSSSAGRSDTDGGTITTFDPSISITYTLDSTDGILYVYIGGTVDASSPPVYGTYTETITISVNYN